MSPSSFSSLKAVNKRSEHFVVSSQVSSLGRQEDSALSVMVVGWSVGVALWFTMVMVDTLLVTLDSLQRCILVAADTSLCFSY